ncbi:hypothetical protein ACKKBG_A28595 [Auxenochlorella protothecoides x Auxenochlorella symbiontica]
MTDQETAPPAPSVPARPRLNLKPRDPEAVARMEAERQASIGKSPFGNAKPREAVIAGRVGKTEEEVLREEVKSTYKLHLRLSPSQLDEKKAQEAVIRQAEETAEAEEDAEKKAELNSEVAVQKEKLAELLGGFEKLALETAMSGSGPRMSSLRRAQAEAAAAAGQYDSAAGGNRYHPTQGYGPPPDAVAGAPPSRGFPNGQYGAAGRAPPRSQGFPEYQQQAGHGARGGEYQEARQGRSQYQEPRQQGGADAATSFHRAPGAFVPGEDSDAGFYDTPSSFDPAAVAGGGQSRGGGSGYRQGGSQGGGRREGGRQAGGGYRQGGGGFGGPRTDGYSGYTPPALSGRGVGGEINFEESYGAGQDRF